jgi:hypothetical protein
MDRPLFEYKFDIIKGRVQFKPYCFRWVLAYRLKELYLWAFSVILRPFARAAKELSRVKPGTELSSSLNDIYAQGFKHLILEKK